jgi:hypothetical protein
MRAAGIAALAALWAVLCLPRPCAAKAERPVYAPDYMRLQYAGQSGLISVGTGYTWWHGTLETGANYGYVPAAVADRRIHVLSEKNSVSLGRLRLDRSLALEPVLLGVAANVSLGNQYQLFLPKAQRDYYWPDALYFWFFGGAKLDYTLSGTAPFKGMAAQVEVGTLNQYWKSYLSNNAVGLDEILSLAISAQFYL